MSIDSPESLSLIMHTVHPHSLTGNGQLPRGASTGLVISKKSLGLNKLQMQADARESPGLNSE